MMETASLAERIEKCERILRENGKSQVFAALADALRTKGDLDEAFRVCRQGLRVHPNFGSAHLVMAKINFERKMFDWAEQELEMAVSLEGETRATEQLRIEIQIAKGNLADAELQLKKLKGSGANPLLIQDLEQRLGRQKREAQRRQVDATGKSFAKTASDAAASTPSIKPVRLLSLQEALDETEQIDGVSYVVCSHTNGTIVDKRGDIGVDGIEAAAFSVEMCRGAITEPALTHFGDPRQIAIETQDRMVVIMRFNRYNLVLFCDPGVNLGSLRLRLEEIAGRLQEG